MNEPFRMMDANLNRVAEGLRVVEDVLRFNFEDRDNCKAARELRHQVRQVFNALYPLLLDKRNVKTDPGVILSEVQALDQKSSWQDLLLANLKRVQEGLRVLEEASHLLGERKFAKQVEKLRFDAYDLELKIAPYLTDKRSESGITKRKLPKGLYALTSETHSLGRSNIEVAREILSAGVQVLQYREKNKKIKQIYEECLVIREMARKAGVLFIVNDYLDVAIAVDADGVHVGQDDLPVKWVREIVGPNRIIGVSTHSPEQAQKAVDDGADYIGVGPIYATKTKTDVCEPVGIEHLRYVVDSIKLPFVAIGGIKEHNLKEVLDNGAKTVALVTEIVGSRDIQGMVNGLQRVIEPYLK